MKTINLIKPEYAAYFATEDGMDPVLCSEFVRKMSGIFGQESIRIRVSVSGSNPRRKGWRKVEMNFTGNKVDISAGRRFRLGGRAINVLFSKAMSLLWDQGFMRSDKDVFWVRVEKVD